MSNPAMDCAVRLIGPSGDRLSPSDLVRTSRSLQSFPITYQNTAGRDLFTVQYTQNSNLLSGNVLREPSTSAKYGLCHFTSDTTHDVQGTLSACTESQLTGVLRTHDNVFIMQIDPHGNFTLVPQIIKSCDVVSRTKRAPQIPKTNPSYYTEHDELRRRRYVEFALVADHSIYVKFDKDLSKVNDYLQTLSNFINSYYLPLNIEVRLVYSEVWADGDKIDVTTSGDETLNQFLTYRKTFLREHPNDNAHFLTNVHFDNGTVGKAYSGTMCSYDYSGGVNVDHASSAALVASTIAHEMGHNFGMAHDEYEGDGSCKCPAVGNTVHCFMAKAAGYVAPSFWSDCSLRYIANSFDRGIDLCLLNPPDTTGVKETCGNGIVEGGEECDCGGDACKNPCCDGKTCRFVENAKCATGMCCDLSTCKPKERATICRPPIALCDLAEYCDGETEECPADFYVADGHLCPGTDNEHCYNGECGSRNDQCAVIWGEGSRGAPDICYDNNMKGSINGNCGYDTHFNNYSICSHEDRMCGRLHCQTDKERPVFGNPSSVSVAYSSIPNRDRKQWDRSCYVIQSAYETKDKKKHTPGMTLDGTKCDTDKICVKTKCTKLSNILKTVAECDDHCNYKGVCNNVGNCHCENGYGGVSCNIPGLGGSVNSNPANMSRGTDVLIISVVFLLMCFAAFVAATIYCRRKKGIFLPAVIWKDVKERLKLRGILVPTRKAPDPPGGHRRMKKDSLNAVWGDGGVVTYSAAPPPLTLESPASSPDPLLANPILAPVRNPVTIGRTPSIRPTEPPPSVPIRPKDTAIKQLYSEHGKELGIVRQNAPPPPPPAHKKGNSHDRPDLQAPPPPPPHKKPNSKTTSPRHQSASVKQDGEKLDVKKLAAKFDKK